MKSHHKNKHNFLKDPARSRGLSFTRKSRIFRFYFLRVYAIIKLWLSFDYHSSFWHSYRSRRKARSNAGFSLYKTRKEIIQ